MQVRVSPDIGVLLDDALTLSLRRGTGFVGVEHLFEAIVGDSDRFPAALSEYIGLFHQAVERAYRDAWKGTMPDTRGETFHTPRAASLVHEAARLAERMRHDATRPEHLLLAILADAHAGPSRALDTVGADRGRLIAVLREHLAKASAHEPTSASRSSSPSPSPEIFADAIPSESAKESRNVVEEFTRDLTEMAQRGQIDPAVGRDRETMEIVEILARKGKRNAILVGEAGTGKTKIVESLACYCARGKLSDVLGDVHILELNIAALISGTEYRGRFEERVSALLDELKRRPDSILFIDEMHMMMGAGATDGDSADLANLLKPALGRGELRCIGATTLKEYRSFVAKDPAIERRFQMVRVEALSPAATRRVLDALLPSLEKHHRVRIKRAAMDTVVQLTERYLPNRNFPDKAIDVLDQACARLRIGAAIGKRSRDTAKPSKVVTPHTVRKIVSQLAAVPIEEITHDERRRLTDLEGRLARKVIGQDEAIGKVSSAVRRARTGLADPDRPDAVMLFLGPTGVGKTELAKQLARQVFGSSSHLIRFDMSEYVEAHSVSRLLGAPPGYVGHGEEGELTRAIKDAPFSVLLFDEIEKAHPRVFDVLLPLLDEGRIKDSDGALVDARNCMIVFTSNIGSELLAGGPASACEEDVLQALREHFRPEFINRVDELVRFYPLLFEDVRAILHKQMNALRVRVEERGLGFHVYQGAYEFLAEKGYSHEFGARALRRAVEQYVVDPISQQILNNELSTGDKIEVSVEDGTLICRKATSACEAVGVAG